MSIKMTTVVDKVSLLNAVEKNRETYIEILQQAREGYVEEVRKKLQRQLKLMKDGKVRSISVQMYPPEDHTAQYDTVIEMLKWSTEDKIELEAREFRQFVMDEWDWMDRFLIENAKYSSIAEATMIGKGLGS